MSQRSPYRSTTWPSEAPTVWCQGIEHRAVGGELVEPAVEDVGLGRVEQRQE